VVRAGDDVLQITKLAIATEPRVVYVVDDDGRYRGAIPNCRLAREVFSHLNPGFRSGAHSTAGLPQCKQNMLQFQAFSLIEPNLRPLRGRQTITDAVENLYRENLDELPVINNDGQLLGIIRSVDILREWAEDLLLTQFGDETGSFD
jgi:CBS domain-containing protein